ncbi:MAG: PLP-dependent aminotransferase family protein, partial [Candidatus Spyradocola sp.]
MDIELTGEAGRPLYLRLRDQLRARLLSGAVAPDTRLPSAREMAALLHVSRNTVFAAYRMLEEEGLLRIVAGQGAFAAPRRACEPPPAGPRLDWDGRICPQARAYADFREHEGRVDLGNRQVISFSSLAPDYHAFENDAFRRALNTVMINEGSVLLAYGYTRGYEPFRAFLRQYLEGKGLRMDGQEILVTSGFRQAAGLVVETLVSPGEAVAVEAPTYNGFLGVLRACGARALPVECDEEGMRPSELARALDAGARLVYLIPT